MFTFFSLRLDKELQRLENNSINLDFDSMLIRAKIKVKDTNRVTLYENTCFGHSFTQFLDRFWAGLHNTQLFTDPCEQE